MTRLILAALALACLSSVAEARPRNLQKMQIAQVVGSRPSGCPHRYCGCALSLKLFGRIIPRLNLAANWLAFPRALPAGGMVAARRGHVFLLKRHITGPKWLVWDPNSGRGRTRLHARSIAGFKIVDPSGASRVRAAEALPQWQF